MRNAREAKDVRDQAQGLDDTRRATSNLLEDIEAERTALVVAKTREDALLASIGDGVIGTDPKGRIMLMNAAAKKILDLTAEKVLGKDLFETIALENEKGEVVLKNDRPVSTVFKTGVAVKISSLYYTDKNKKKVPLALDITPIILKRKIIGTVNVFRDITKEKELERAKNDFISLASHQLQSPVTAISWSLERLLGEHKGPLNKDQKESIEEVLELAQNMTELVGGFLQVTRMESTGFAVEKSEVDLVQIADSILKELEGKISDKKTVIVKKYGANIPHCTIGEKTARIIFQNLLTNAIKYTPEGGTVELTIEKTTAGISIAVKDNGYGIPEDAKGKIFTKLFRADNIRQKEPSGTGLGLYLLKSLVDKLGGKTWFESKEGAGSTFHVTFASSWETKTAVPK